MSRRNSTKYTRMLLFQKNIFLAIAITTKWKVRSAFLQGNKFDREVYLKPLAELETDKLLKLNEPAYGICDSLHGWYLRKTVLEKSEDSKS